MFSELRVSVYKFKSMHRIFCTNLLLNNTSTDTVVFKRLSNKEFKKLDPAERHSLALAKLKSKMKQKRKQRSEAYASLSETEKQVIIEQKYELHRLTEERMKASLISGIRVCVDMSLDHVHTDHDRSSLFTQLLFGYTYMKKCKYPIHLHITSINTPKLVEGVNTRGYNNWYAHVDTLPPWEFLTSSNSHGSNSINANCSNTGAEPAPVLSGNNCSSRGVDKRDMIILSPDATEVLLAIDPSKVSQSVSAGVHVYESVISYLVCIGVHSSRDSG